MLPWMRKRYDKDLAGNPHPLRNEVPRNRNRQVRCRKNGHHQAAHDKRVGHGCGHGKGRAHAKGNPEHRVLAKMPRPNSPAVI